MACHGVSFAITPVQEHKLLSLDGDNDALPMYVQEDIEEQWDEGHLVEFDKSWDAMHRCLTDGQLAYDNGDFPLSHCVLGGHPLYTGDDYIISYKSAVEVIEVSKALNNVTRSWMRERYDTIQDYDSAWGDDDFEYTWEYFEAVKEFYNCAAAAERAVIFSVDQ